MNNQALDSIKNALEHALSLISEEYETLQDEELRQKYDVVLAKLKIALEQIKQL